MSHSSTLSQILPLLILLFIISIIAFIGYQIYLGAQQIGSSASQRISNNHNNLVFTRDGVKLSVKSVGDESYVDKTQSVLVKAWTLGRESGREEAGEKKSRWRRKS